MKKFREEKGITLIALIITIVVLLILAIVAIGQAQESNIVGYAQNASSRYTEEQAKEVNMLGSYETLIQSVMGPWSPLTVPVQFDKKYSNYITVDGETQYLEIILYSDGRLDYFGEKLSKEEVVGAIEEGYIKVTSKAFELDGVKLEFSSDGKKINIYVEGQHIGVLELQEEQPIGEWTTYGTEAMYFLVGTDKAYSIVQGNLFGTYTVETGTLEGSNEYKDYTIPENVRGASKVLISGEGSIGAVIMPNGSFYMINYVGDKGIETSQSGINNNIDYSSILDQIQ